jgi:hypothetical protein
MLSATVGPPIPGAAALGELRRSIPPSLVEALDKIGDRIRVEILDPLLCACSDEELAATFERVFPKFRDYYVWSILILQGSLHEDVQRFAALTIRSFRESEDLIRSAGPKWMGQAAYLNALHGVSTIIGIVKAAARLIEQGRLADIGTNQALVEQWANSLLAYTLAFSALLAPLTALAEGNATSARLENVVALASQSTRYAVKAYHLSKVIGLLKTMPFHGPGDQGDEEDLILAEAGLEVYVEMLRQYDLP